MSTIHQAASKLKGRKRKKKACPLRSFLKAPHRKGIVLKTRIMKPKKPNSARRKVVRVKLSTRFRVTAKLKGRGQFLQKFAHVMVTGGRANDLPGVRYNMIKGKYDLTWKETFTRMNGRSKYGVKHDDFAWIMYQKLNELFPDLFPDNRTE